MSLCTVTGNVKTLIGASAGVGTIYFSLNYNGPAYISGTGVLVPTKVTGAIASDGSFSVALQGNDTISPSGTLYIMTVILASGGTWEALYSITGVSFNINTAVPTGAPSVPVFTNALFPTNTSSPLTPSGTINGSNKVFTLPTTPGTILFIFRNGVLQQGGGNDFTLTGSTVTFVSAPSTGDIILAVY